MRRWVVACGLLGLTVGLVAVSPVEGAEEAEATGAPPSAEALPAPLAPHDLPPADLSLGPRTVETIRAHREAGDRRRALRVAESFVAGSAWGRERDGAWMVVGLLHRAAGRHNLASEAFTKVRAGKGPLTELATFYEAEQDLARGREWVAIRECESYRKAYPKGEHAGACQRLIATAHAKLGNTGTARAAAREYDDDHDNATISEQIELQMALQLVQTEPEAAIARLQHLSISHDAPLTGRVAEEQLHDLRLAGVDTAVVPDDTASLQLRAVSLRDVKRKDEAWAAFEQLSERAEDDPKLQRWVADSAERFGWRTHRWDYLAEFYRERYEADGEAKDAWSRYRVLGRGGKHTDAAEVALAAQKAHAGSREWRRKDEDVGRTMLLAGRYPDAVTQFDRLAARGGWTGRRGRFYAAFASLMAGEVEDAKARFDVIIEDDRSYVTEAHYWRSRALDLLEQVDDAQADRQWILQEDPVSWYALLVHQLDDELPQIKPLARSGGWVGPAPAPPAPRPTSHGPTFAASEVPISAPVDSTMTTRRPVGFASLAWSPIQPPALPGPSVLTRLEEVQPPESYRASALHDPDAAARAMSSFSRHHGDAYPELRAIEDLARVGLYDLSGPMMSQWFEDWRKSYRAGRAAARRIVGMKTEDWRKLFLFSRDHHHAARFTYEWWDDLDEEQLQQEAWRLSHPLAHDHTVWEQGRRHGIDPYLVLGLMRQESTYNAVAVSRVGASGAMQIMPRTGHLLADLAHDVDFSAGDLEDPTLSITYGITYLGLLMQRFDGAYPLAIASYNGGPFNVSAWLAGTGADMPMDAFVEHIPFRETRDYVKKVSKGYASYVDLYGPDGAAVVLPATPRGDHPEVVDF